jgi:hypothetical protein
MAKKSAGGGQRADAGPFLDPDHEDAGGGFREGDAPAEPRVETSSEKAKDGSAAPARRDEDRAPARRDEDTSPSQEDAVPITIEMPARTVEAVEIKLPLVDLELRDIGYVSRHVNVHLSQKQSLTLNKIFRGLHATHQTMEDGRHVDKRPDVIRWILDQIESIYAGSEAAG